MGEEETATIADKEKRAAAATTEKWAATTANVEEQGGSSDRARSAKYKSGQFTSSFPIKRIPEKSRGKTKESRDSSHSESLNQTWSDERREPLRILVMSVV